MLIVQIAATEEHSSEAGYQARFRKYAAKGNRQCSTGCLKQAF